MSWVNLFFNKFAAPVAQQTAEPAGPLKRKYPKPTGYKKYTYSEIAKHSTPDDAWVIVDDGEGPKVYDVSAMKHPGVSSGSHWSYFGCRGCLPGCGLLAIWL